MTLGTGIYLLDMSETEPGELQVLSEEALALKRERAVANISRIMAEVDRTQLDWHGGAFQVAFVDISADNDYIALVRHGDDPDGPVLTFTSGEWTAFIGNEQGGARNGEFNRFGVQTIRPGETT